MRIVAGKWRSRPLIVPDTAQTRPTMDRTREAVFNILRSASWAMGASGAPLLNDAHVVDVYAGSGAMGFEALSQGAKSAVFFENGKPACAAIEKNIATFKAEAVLFKTTVERLPLNKGGFADIAFIDPPYDQELVPVALERLLTAQWITAETLLVIETRKTESVADITILDTRLYGMAKMTFAKLA